MEASIRDFPRDACSVASTLEVIGERWTLHVLRESFLGVRRFEDFHRNIGVARNILSDRLNTLVAEGILRRELYNERPARYEYRLTRKGVDLLPVMLSLMDWGDRYLYDGDAPVTVHDRTTDEQVRVEMRTPSGRRVEPNEMDARVNAPAADGR